MKGIKRFDGEKNRNFAGKKTEKKGFLLGWAGGAVHAFLGIGRLAETFLQRAVHRGETAEDLIVFQELKGIVDLRLHTGQNKAAARVLGPLEKGDDQAPSPAADIIGFGKIQDQSFLHGRQNGLKGLVQLGKGIGVKEPLDFEGRGIRVKGVVMNVDRNGFHEDILRNAFFKKRFNRKTIKVNRLDR
jgi:hypothetical protein